MYTLSELGNHDVFIHLHLQRSREHHFHHFIHRLLRIFSMIFKSYVSIFFVFGRNHDSSTKWRLKFKNVELVFEEF